MKAIQTNWFDIIDYPEPRSTHIEYKWGKTEIPTCATCRYPIKPDPALISFVGTATGKHHFYCFYPEKAIEHDLKFLNGNWVRSGPLPPTKCAR